MGEFSPCTGRRVRGSPSTPFPGHRMMPAATAGTSEHRAAQRSSSPRPLSSLAGWRHGPVCGYHVLPTTTRGRLQRCQSDCPAGLVTSALTRRCSTSSLRAKHSPQSHSIQPAGSGINTATLPHCRMPKPCVASELGHAPPPSIGLGHAPSAPAEQCCGHVKPLLSPWGCVKSPSLAGLAWAPPPAMRPDRALLHPSWLLDWDHQLDPACGWTGHCPSR